jgi:hypothetical protein
VVRIRALIEHAINGHAASGAGTGDGVRQIHLEDFTRLVSPRSRAQPRVAETTPKKPSQAYNAR